jgi:hypothetical protein
LTNTILQDLWRGDLQKGIEYQKQDNQIKEKKNSKEH